MTVATSCDLVRAGSSAVLAAVFAVAIAACSAIANIDEVKFVDDAGAAPRTDGGTDGANNDANDTNDATGGACTTRPGPSSVEAKPAAEVQKVCTNQDLSALSDAAADPNATAAAIEAGLRARNAACASCVFTHWEDPAWGPIVYYPAGNENEAFLNEGACIARHPSGSASCGAALTKRYICLDTACSPVRCPDDEERAACDQRSLGDGTSCGRFQSEVAAACSGISGAVEASCANFVLLVRELCGVSG